jgi:hypothetical protein
MAHGPLRAAIAVRLPWQDKTGIPSHLPVLPLAIIASLKIAHYRQTKDKA